MRGPKSFFMASVPLAEKGDRANNHPLPEQQESIAGNPLVLANLAAAALRICRALRRNALLRSPLQAPRQPNQREAENNEERSFGLRPLPGHPVARSRTRIATPNATPSRALKMMTG